MLPQSVKTRHRAMYDFECCYEQLCSLQASVPLQFVKAHLQEGVIDINGDKIRMLDWAPILDSIKINKNLKYIAIQSFFQLSNTNSSKKTHYFKRKTPAICSKDVTQWLATSLRSCLMVTSALQCLDLQGVPLRERDVSILSNGIEKNASLSFVSFNYCQIADKGVQVFCQSVRNHPTLSHVGLCGCNITKKGTIAIAKLIKHQSTVRHGEAWADSLRYRIPNLNRMGGIRRISLNCNPMIGDEGIEIFNEALKDDLWLKALDFQLCGLSTKGALSLLETMQYNRTLVVLDVRQNPMIDSTTLRTLLGRVLMNASESDEVDYPWVKAEAPKDPYCTKRYRSPKTSNRNFAKKSVAKPSRSVSSENLSSRTRNKFSPKYKSSLAWQTAVNSSQHNHKDKPNFNVLYQSDEFRNPEAHESNHGSDSIMNSSFLNESNLTLNQSQAFIKQLKIELINSQRKLQAALESEKMLNAKILTLEVENARLKKDLTASFENSKFKSQIEDEAFLDSIEQSFNKFHDFLTKLRDAGMGSLAAEAGFNEDFVLPRSKTAAAHQAGYSNDLPIQSKTTLASETSDNKPSLSPRFKTTLTSEPGFNEESLQPAVLQKKDIEKKVDHSQKDEKQKLFEKSNIEDYKVDEKLQSDSVPEQLKPEKSGTSYSNATFVSSKSSSSLSISEPTKDQDDSSSSIKENFSFTSNSTKDSF